jgi:hypothetical protein
MPFSSVKTTMAKAYAGMQNGLNKNQVVPGLNEEAATELPWGVAVKQGTADDGVLALTAVGNFIKGIVQSSHAMARDPGTGVGELGSTGVMPKAVADIAEAGELWVKIEEDVTPTSAVRIRVAGGGTPGAFRATSAGGGNSVDVSRWCRYKGTYSVASDGCALLEFNFRHKELGTAD